MRRPLLLLVPLLALAACETPREACVGGVARQIATVEGLIAETRGNLERGYAIREEQVIRTVPDFCEIEGEDGRVRRGFCERTEVRDVERPVAFDPGTERAKLDGLLAQREVLAAEQGARLQACQALPDQ